MYTKYNDPAANAYAKMCGVKMINEADEDQSTATNPYANLPPSPYTEEERDAWRKALIDQLINHNSGIKKYLNIPNKRNEVIQIVTNYINDLDFDDEDAYWENIPRFSPASVADEVWSQLYETFKDSVTESTCCKKAKVTTAKPVSKKMKVKGVNESIDWEKLLGDLRNAREIAINFLEDYVVENDLGEEGEKVYMLLDDLKRGEESSITTITGHGGIIDCMKMFGIPSKDISKFMKALLEEVEVID